MARPRSQLVQTVKEKLIARLDGGLYRSGDRFMSNRAIAQQFEISYQTADRIVRELVEEGRLSRRAASGTYVAGKPSQRTGVQFIFNRRAQRKDSFGARLLNLLQQRLTREEIDCRTVFCDAHEVVKPSADRFAILWEAIGTMTSMSQIGQAALLLNHRPPPGLAALRIDSVQVDDFFGGACAGQLLMKRVTDRAKLIILAGPKGDARSDLRVAGFLSVCKARVVHAPSWYYESALPTAQVVLGHRPSAIFACNDRLAQAVLETGKQNVPPIVGFDDAPIAEALHLTTIAIPWREVVDTATQIVIQRITQRGGTASHTLLMPRPIVRLT
jgi:DNA-binding transcriptional regulator YhcF (GntR family)